MTARARLVFGIADLVCAALVALGVFAGLPARYAPVDVGAALVVVLMGASGAMLLGKARLAGRIARIASAVTLALGALLVALASWSASYLWGIYAPVGRGGAVILLLVAALALPYLVVFPAVQLVWLAPAQKEKGQEARAEIREQAGDA